MEDLIKTFYRNEWLFRTAANVTAYVGYTLQRCCRKLNISEKHSRTRRSPKQLSNANIKVTTSELSGCVSQWNVVVHVGNFCICTQPVNYDKNLPLLRCSILTCDDSSVPCTRMQCLAHPRTGWVVRKASYRETIPKKQLQKLALG